MSALSMLPDGFEGAGILPLRRPRIVEGAEAEKDCMQLAPEEAAEIERRGFAQVYLERHPRLGETVFFGASRPSIAGPLFRLRGRARVSRVERSLLGRSSPRGEWAPMFRVELSFLEPLPLDDSRFFSAFDSFRAPAGLIERESGRGGRRN